MPNRCPTCGKFDPRGMGILPTVTHFKCPQCLQEEKERQYVYSDIYPVKILQKGYGRGRRQKNTEEIPLFFEPKIPFLLEGDQDSLMVPISDFETELSYIGKGSMVKMSFFKDEFGRIKIRNLGV